MILLVKGSAGEVGAGGEGEIKLKDVLCNSVTNN